MKNTVSLAIVSAFMMSSAAMAADEYAKYGDSAPWEIWENVTAKSCFLQDRDNNGNLVQMGLRTNKDKLAFMGVWNHTEDIMQPGEKRDMMLDVDGKEFTFTAEANKGTVTEGYHGAYMYFNNPDFISALENGNMLTVHVDADTAVKVDLAGSKKAIETGVECYNKMQ